MGSWLPPTPPWRLVFGVGLKLLALATVAVSPPEPPIHPVAWVGVGIDALGTVYFVIGCVQWRKKIG